MVQNLGRTRTTDAVASHSCMLRQSAVSAHATVLLAPVHLQCKRQLLI